MSSIAHWDDDPDSWDRLRLAKFVMPGVWTVSYQLKRDIDVKKAGGVDGARFKDKGYEPTQLTLTGELSTAEEWKSLQEIFPEIHPRRKGASREALAIDHPATRVAAIGLVYVTEIDAPELRDGKLTCSIRCIEYVPVPKKVGKQKPPLTDTTTSVYDTPPMALLPFPGFKNYVLE